jgi:predicted nucleic acid-binding protein
MPRPRLFLDSSVLFAGVVSADGASRALLALAEGELIAIVVSEQVVAETERALARKAPRALPTYREALRSTGLTVVRDPAAERVAAHGEIIAHRADAPIVVSAMEADVNALVTLNRRHFIDDPGVAERSGLCICTPADALTWIREQLSDRRA